MNLSRDFRLQQRSNPICPSRQAAGLAHGVDTLHQIDRNGDAKLGFAGAETHARPSLRALLARLCTMARRGDAIPDPPWRDTEPQARREGE